MTLFINLWPEVKNIWNPHPTYEKAKINEDSGLDVPLPDNITIPANAISFKINLKFKTEPNHGYMLVPRSSLAKKPIRLSNSIGIIDKNYRGDICVIVDNLSNNDVFLKESNCYFQIVAFDGKLPKFQITEVTEKTSRGSGGFGSSGYND